MVDLKCYSTQNNAKYYSTQNNVNFMNKISLITNINFPPTDNVR